VIFEYFRKFVEKIQLPLKRGGKWGGDTLHEDLSTFMISRSICLIMRNVSVKSCREKQNIFYVHSIFSENRAVYEIMWKNMVNTNTTDENMAHAHCILDT
jgi:hypothetical protein